MGPPDTKKGAGSEKKTRRGVLVFFLVFSFYYKSLIKILNKEKTKKKLRRTPYLLFIRLFFSSACTYKKNGSPSSFFYQPPRGYCEYLISFILALPIFFGVGPKKNRKFLNDIQWVKKGSPFLFFWGFFEHIGASSFSGPPLFSGGQTEGFFLPTSFFSFLRFFSSYFVFFFFEVFFYFMFCLVFFLSPPPSKALNPSLAGPLKTPPLSGGSL